jgi:uncharacterized protein YdcH (DUF465 family)
MEVAMSALARLAIATWTVAVGAAAIIGLLVATGAADAQDTNIRRLLSPDETRRCICEEAEIQQLQAKMAESDPLRQEFERLDKIVENARPNIDTSDAAEVDSFRRLYYRREDLRLQLEAERGPYLSQLNGIVAGYNARCANAPMLKVNVDAVHADPNACVKP